MKYPIYTITDVALIPLFHTSHSDNEIKYLELFKSFDLTKDFYFSHVYRLDNTVQNNYSISVDETDYGLETNTKFIYNQFHLDCLKDISTDLLKASVRVIHGYISITPISLSGRIIDFYLISRRSRHYAGTRYRKRGINSEGHVANEVQTEIIVYDCTLSNSVMSYVQLRGSIPLFWTQKLPVSILKKPPVLYPLNDGTLSSTRRHFSHLFAQYGVPIICLNLLSDDLYTDEGQLSHKFNQTIHEINLELPESIIIQYVQRDLRNYQLLGKCEQMMSETAAMCIDKTSFFHMKNNQILSIQSGIIRSSCLDCLDRTNTMIQRVSFVAVAKMFHHINLLSTPDLSNDPLIFEALKYNIDSMGDRLSLQYGGSRVLKKYEADQTVVDQSAQLLTIFKRRYKNSFADADKQVSINLFLGVLKPAVHSAPWEQDLDPILHSKRVDEFCGADWWVLPLQIFYNRFRTLSPYFSSSAFKFHFKLIPCGACATLDWYKLYSGNPQKCPFVTKITYIPWWILKFFTKGPSASPFISDEYNLQYFIDNILEKSSADLKQFDGLFKHKFNIELPALSKYILENYFTTISNPAGRAINFTAGYYESNLILEDFQALKDEDNTIRWCHAWSESNYNDLFKRQLKFKFVNTYTGLYKL